MTVKSTLNLNQEGVEERMGRNGDAEETLFQIRNIVDCTCTGVQRSIQKSPKTKPFFRFLLLPLALCYLQQQCCSQNPTLQPQTQISQCRSRQAINGDTTKKGAMSAVAARPPLAIPRSLPTKAFLLEKKVRIRTPWPWNSSISAVLFQFLPFWAIRQETILSLGNKSNG